MASLLFLWFEIKTYFPGFKDSFRTGSDLKQTNPDFHLDSGTTAAAAGPGRPGGDRAAEGSRCWAIGSFRGNPERCVYKRGSYASITAA